MVAGSSKYSMLAFPLQPTYLWIVDITGTFLRSDHVPDKPRGQPYEAASVVLQLGS